jgi:hypothetical protein
VNWSLGASGSGRETARRSSAACGVRRTARTDLRWTLHWSGVGDGARAVTAARVKWSKKSRARETDAYADRELLSVCSSSCEKRTSK